MYCTSCGKQIANDAVFCRYCGKPTSQDGALADLVAAARMGNQDAVSALYEKTYSKVYYTVKSMIKNEDAVFDIVQDTYIKAFAHLDSFQGDTKFLPWVRQIAANTARDWLKKKRPLLFTELSSSDEQATPVEELFPDERSENLPELFIDQEETKRLLREIIEELPEDQRAAIGMFYYEELSVKEIAAAMEVSESAIKSRLMYGRGKIEKKVRELEKQGTKLYSLSPIPFLLLLFRNQKVYAAEAPDGQLLQTILASRPMGATTAAGAFKSTGTAGTTAGAFQGVGMAGTTAGAETAGAASAGTAAISGGLGALKTGLIAFAAMATVGLGVFGATQMASLFDEYQESSAMEDDMDREDSKIREEAKVREETKIPEALEEPEEPSPIDETLEQYRIILGQADSYEFGETIPGFETAGYRYALVQMQPDDLIPTLLLEKEERDAYGCVMWTRIFQYDPNTKTVHQPAEAIPGGIRGGLSIAGDGNGILDIAWFGAELHGYVTRITLEGDSLKQDTLWTGQINLMPDSITFSGIEWQEIGDLSALNDWTTPDSGGTSPSEPAPTDALPTDGDRIVLTGTLGTYSYDEIIALQGQPDPNAPYYDEAFFARERSRIYHVILLDTPQTLHIRQLDEYISAEASMICIGAIDDIDQYEGRHITFSIDPDTSWWPTDTSLPLDQPYANDIRIFDGENFRDLEP